MKLLIISDVHSNLPCLEAVLAHEADADRIYCAGDCVDVGLYPKETVRRVRASGAVTVRGNHDDKVIRKFHALPPPPDEPWTFPLMNALHLGTEEITWLEQLPLRVRFVCDGVAYLMQHLYRGYESIASEEEFLAFWDDPETARDRSLRKVCIFGHTHRPAIDQFREDCLVINPGSVGYNRPDDPSIATRYLTITDGEIALRELTHPHCMARPVLGETFHRLYGHRRGPVIA